MLSEADIGRTEHTTLQSAVLDIQGKSLPMAWDFKKLDRTVMFKWEAFTPACSGSSVRTWELNQQDSGYLWNPTL